MKPWSAAQYAKFEDERNRPTVELIARIPLTQPNRVIDLGCGPGNSTEMLATRFPNAEVIGEDTGSARTDTLVILHTGPDGNIMLPLPRDLFIPIVGTKGRDRINTAIQGGPVRLIQTVEQSLGIPVHHYIEMDFVGFLELVDAVGGVVINFDAPAFDDNSGLDIKTAGLHKLNRDQALAYVRSRHYTRIINGKNVVDPTADLGRIARQRVRCDRVAGGAVPAISADVRQRRRDAKSRRR